MTSLIQRHERDAVVLHQEYLLRLNEGDDVDTSSDQKIAVQLQHIDEGSSSATITFLHEDHTVGNPLRHVLMQNSNVSTAGYSIPHPLEPKMLLHVQSTDYAVDVVADGLERLAEICDVACKSFNHAMKHAIRQ